MAKVTNYKVNISSFTVITVTFGVCSADEMFVCVNFLSSQPSVLGSGTQFTNME